MNAGTTKSVRLRAAGCAVVAACIIVYGAAPVPEPQGPETLRAPATQQAHTPNTNKLPATTFSPPVEEVLRLLNSGVSDAVVTAYIQNSLSVYSLPADKIIALKEQGVSSDVIVAMIARTKELREGALQAVARVRALEYMESARIAQSVSAGEPQTPAMEMPSPASGIPPSSYYNQYWYSTAPALAWWSPPVSFYSVDGHFYRHHRGHQGLKGVPPAAQPQRRWADAYPNRLVVGPNWGADRGAAPVQARWADAYPNRLIAGPNWGADRGSAPRQARWADAYPNRVITGPNWGANRASIPRQTAPSSGRGAISVQRPSGFAPATSRGFSRRG